MEHAAIDVRPSRVHPCGRNRKACNNENATNCPAKQSKCIIPFISSSPQHARPRCPGRAAHPNKSPPKAGAFSGEGCQLNARTRSVLVELCRRPRPIEPQYQTIIVECHAPSVVFTLLGPKLAKVSLDRTLSVFNGNVTTYEPTQIARGSAESFRATRLPHVIVKYERPSL